MIVESHLQTRTARKKTKFQMLSLLEYKSLENADIVIYPFECGAISAAQISPIIRIARRLKLRLYAARTANTEIERRVETPKQRSACKVVFLQSRWDTPNEEIIITIDRIRNSHPLAKIVFLDYYAPLHIPHSEIFPHIDLYVKKQYLRDLSQYTTGMQDTNLVEYESQWSKNLLQGPFHRVPANEIENKLFLGWNFATAPYLMRELQRGVRHNGKRDIFLHCRITAPVRRDDWYSHMRGRTLDAVVNASKNNQWGALLAAPVHIPFRKYMQELNNSFCCLSPFGYGEICWRDFEAFAAGALLIKPDMSHLVTEPNLFEAWKTYLPIHWDYSNLQETMDWAKEHQDECDLIQKEAVVRWKQYLGSGFQDHWQKLCNRLAINF